MILKATSFLFGVKLLLKVSLNKRIYRLFNTILIQFSTDIDLIAASWCQIDFPVLNIYIKYSTNYYFVFLQLQNISNFQFPFPNGFPNQGP